MNGSCLLADDLSGALEAGAAFRAGGRAVTLALDPLKACGNADGLQVISSETRNAAPAVAAETVARILRAQQSRGTRLVLKKVDSTLRGPFCAEIKALIDVLAPPLTVVCPANPAVGRTVVNGRLLVRGVPVAETEFGRDPVSPVRMSRIEDLLDASGLRGVSTLSLRELRELPVLDSRHGRGVVVSDAETREDLQRLVQRVRAREPAAVFVGSGGLAHALAGADHERVRTQWSIPARVLIVSGSKHAQSRRQLEFLRDRHGVPLHEIEHTARGDEETVAAIARDLSVRGVAALTVRKDFSADDPVAPVRRLTKLVAMLAAAGTEPEMIAATGGESAHAICLALGVDHLELIEEIEPGVVVARVGGTLSRNLSLIAIKPGGFGSEEIWSKIVRS